MALQVFGASAVVSMLNRAFTDTSAGYAFFNNQVAQAGSTADSQMAFAKTFGAQYSGQTASALATLLMANVGLTGTELNTALTGYITAAGTANIGIVALQLGQLLSSLEGDATYGTAATAWNAEVNNAFLYSSNSANTSASTSGTSSTGQTFTLTVGTDNVVGTSANETIDASRVISSGVAYNSLNNADSIDGGAGNDTLAIQMSEASDITPASIKNVETVSLEVMSNNAAADRTLTMGGADSSITTLTMANGAGTAGQLTTVANLQSALTNLNISNTLRDHTVTIANTKLTGTADALALSLSGVTGGTGQTISVGTVSAASGYETINITSSGTATNTITLDDGNGNSLSTLSVAGDRALTMTVVPTTVTKVDASAFTAALTLTAAASNGQAMSVVGGTGNDSINVNGYTTADTINGGTGTDTLVITSAEATAATATQSNVSGIEVIAAADISNGTNITVSNFGATGYTLFAGAHTSNVVATYAAGTNSFSRSGSTDNGNETTTLTISGVATTDVLNVTLGSTTTASVWDGTGAFTINGAETVNVLTQFGAATIGGALTLTNTASTESVVITGDQTLTITGLVTADAVNASGMTGTAALAMNGGGGANSMTITGTGNADTLIGGSAADIISGGAGADIIQNAVSGANSAANDILTGGAGFDTFRLVGSVAATATNYNGVAFISDFTVGATVASSDILSIDVTNATYDTSKIAQGATDVALSATAAGSTNVQTVAQNAAAAAIGTNTQLIKLTTGVAFTTDVQGTFNAAIGTATVTTATAASDYLVSLYDTTNSRMVLLSADPGAANTVIGTGDTVVLIGTLSMSAADYASFGANNFSIVNF